MVDNVVSIASLPVFKSVGPVLSTRSAHPTSIHTGWPLSMLQSAWRRATHFADFESYKCRFLMRLRDHGFSHSLLQLFEEHSVYIAPFDRKHRQQASRRNSNPLQIWHAFPYHPLWANTISRFIGTFFGDRLIRACLAIVFGHEADVRLRVAWSLAALPFGATLVAW